MIFKIYLPFFPLAAESASEGFEAADGWGGGDDRPAGAQQEEAAQRAGRATGSQRATQQSTQSSAQRDEVKRRRYTQTKHSSVSIWILHKVLTLKENDVQQV